MKRPNIDEFINKAKTEGYPIRDWVDEPRFESLYVRYVNRHVRAKDTNEKITYNGTLDIANVTVEDGHRGQGVFTDLLVRLRNRYPDLPIYIENPLETRFQDHLRRLGLTETEEGFCFFLPPGQQINTQEIKR